VAEVIDLAAAAADTEVAVAVEEDVNIQHS
jgi:hypothetical protein